MTVSLLRNEITDENGNTLVRVGYYVTNEFTRWYNRGTGFVWEGAEWYGKNAEGGDTVSHGYNAMRNAEYEDGRARWGTIATHVSVPATEWGDYCGSTYTRSNLRSLKRDYPDTFVTVTDHYGYECLMLPVDAYIPEDLAKTLVSLADEYPVYDEGDQSELEQEIETESWDSYGRNDFQREVENALGDDTEFDSAEIPDATIDHHFGEFRMTDVIDFPVFEDATSCYWPGLVDAAKKFAEMIESGDIPCPKF